MCIRDRHINILVAIFSEKESHAVYLLTKHGVSRLDVVTFISHGKKSKKEDVGVISHLICYPLILYHLLHLHPHS